MKFMKLKKFLSLFLVVLVCVSVFSVNVYAKTTDKIKTSISHLTSKDGLWQYDADFEEGLAYLKKYYGTEKILTLPTEIDGNHINAVDSLDNTYVEHITIPRQYVEFYAYAFEGCKSLKTVEFSQEYTSGWTIKRFDPGCFRNCKKLESVVMPNMLDGKKTYNMQLRDWVEGGEIPSSTFKGCSSLTNVTFPENLTQIGNDVFNGCTSIEKIVIPEGVVSIYSGAFANTPSLKTLVLPDSLGEKGLNGTFNGVSKDLNVVCSPESAVEKKVQYLNEWAPETYSITSVSSVDTDVEGDINRDQKFNIKDVTWYQKYLVKLLDNVCVNELKLDFNNDGKQNILDCTAMQKALAKG